jgi:L-histidine N-alpha-methyltransferase
VINKQLAKDVLDGLSSTPKTLSSKYFYNKKGDALFQQIMGLNEYYLTRAEYAVFDQYKKDWLGLFQNTGKPFQLIEFGAGDCYKTKVLLDAFTETEADFQYVPIDISKNILNVLEADLSERYPKLDIQPVNTDYFKALEELDKNTTHRKVILFLGSNIGNFTSEQAIAFLGEVQQRLSKDDLILIGIDLKKDPKTILAAYNDEKGITRDFNLNLLDRINEELGANFEVENFIHSPIYNPMTGEARSYLVTKKAQTVRIDALNQSFELEAWEAIHTEISRKYSLSQIEHLAKQAGFSETTHFFDEQIYFVDTIWRV